eukprot:scaffold4783_cov134-Pinguiococcus_pyrenoidosus.AAC.1
MEIFSADFVGDSDSQLSGVPGFWAPLNHGGGQVTSLDGEGGEVSRHGNGPSRKPKWSSPLKCLGLEYAFSSPRLTSPHLTSAHLSSPL